MKNTKQSSSARGMRRTGRGVTSDADREREAADIARQEGLPHTPWKLDNRGKIQPHGPYTGNLEGGC